MVCSWRWGLTGAASGHDEKPPLRMCRSLPAHASSRDGVVRFNDPGLAMIRAIGALVMRCWLIGKFLFNRGVRWVAVWLLAYPLCVMIVVPPSRRPRGDRTLIFCASSCARGDFTILLVSRGRWA